MASTVRSPAQQATPPATAPTPSAPADGPVPPGSRWESVWLALRLAGDLLSTPFHILAFLCTRGRQRRRLLDELHKAAR
jgi:hypothetical protein